MYINGTIVGAHVNHPRERGSSEETHGVFILPFGLGSKMKCKNGRMRRDHDERQEGDKK